MSEPLFREGGPNNVRRVGPETYEMFVSIPLGEDGMLARECSAPNCSPAYFRVRTGTGITEGQTVVFCPYCRHAGKPGEFLTHAQLNYAKGIVTDEAAGAVNRMIRDALGLGPSGRRTIDGGLLSMELSLQTTHRSTVPRPIEEELRRDLTCPECGLDHAVFGLAAWCPDCGVDLFVHHVRQEFDVIRKTLAAIPERRTALGARVAARDVENALEDTVSIFEAVLKVMAAKRLSAQGHTPQEIDGIFLKTIRNTFQNIRTAAETFHAVSGAELFDGLGTAEREELDRIFAMRHPITHNLGIVDRRYLQRVQSGELVGREVRVESPQVERAMELALGVLERAYNRLFLKTKP